MVRFERAERQPWNSAKAYMARMKGRLIILGNHPIAQRAVTFRSKTSVPATVDGKFELGGALAALSVNRTLDLYQRWPIIKGPAGRCRVRTKVFNVGWPRSDWNLDKTSEWWELRLKVQTLHPLLTVRSKFG
jgi:hypothetical protein